MPRLLLLTTIAASAIGLGIATRAVASPWRRALTFKRFEQVTPVSLAGLATIDLPPSFKPVGRGKAGTRSGNFSPETLDQHGNPDEITFRFEQGQHHVAGGYLADPVLMHVTLMNPASPPPDVSKITFTHIPRFYPPVDDDQPRFDAHFAAQRWLPDVRTGEAVTRAAATNEGRGDNLVSGPPERWLVIHVDPVRRVRIDLYTWRKAYSVDDARTLVRRAAESVKVTPKLAQMFEGVKTLDARTAAAFERTVSDAFSKLRACGLEGIKPGTTTFGGACAAYWSANRTQLHVARAIGRVPLAASIREPGEDTKYRVVPLPPGRPKELIGEPDFSTVMFFWDAGESRWRMAGLEERFDDHELRESPLVAAIAARLIDRESVYLASLARNDLAYGADRVAIDAFLSESERAAAALRAGTIITGVKAAPDDFGR